MRVLCLMTICVLPAQLPYSTLSANAEKQQILQFVTGQAIQSLGFNKLH